MAILLLEALRKINPSQHLLLFFYHCSMANILTHGILVWYNSSSAADRKALKKIIREHYLKILLKYNYKLWRTFSLPAAYRR